MKNYDFGAKFHALYDRALAGFAQGKRGAEKLAGPEDAAFLASHGITAQHVYDYVEDKTNYGEPDFEIALGIELIRRDYFLNVQRGVASPHVSDPAKYPAKSASIQGIGWLPRLLPKARAKLRGELAASVMYCCGGDRAFFQEHDIEPAEFLHLVWRHENNDEPIVDWVLHRRAARPH